MLFALGKRESPASTPLAILGYFGYLNVMFHNHSKKNHPQNQDYTSILIPMFIPKIKSMQSQSTIVIPISSKTVRQRCLKPLLHPQRRWPRRPRHSANVWRGTVWCMPCFESGYPDVGSMVGGWANGCLVLRFWSFSIGISCWMGIESLQNICLKQVPPASKSHQPNYWLALKNPTNLGHFSRKVRP